MLTIIIRHITLAATLAALILLVTAGIKSAEAGDGVCMSHTGYCARLTHDSYRGYGHGYRQRVSVGYNRHGRRYYSYRYYGRRHGPSIHLTFSNTRVDYGQPQSSYVALPPKIVYVQPAQVQPVYAPAPRTAYSQPQADSRPVGCRQVREWRGKVVDENGEVDSYGTKCYMPDDSWQRFGPVYESQ